MTDTIEVYEFCVQIWEEDGEFHYGIVQEFESQNSDEVEALGYGTADTLEEAAAAAGERIKELF